MDHDTEEGGQQWAHFVLPHKLKQTERQAVTAVKAAVCSSAAHFPRVTEKKKGKKFCSKNMLLYEILVES